MPNDKTNALVIPLAHWADRQLRLLADETGSHAIASLNGATLLGERAALNGFAIPGRLSAGRKCHLLAAQGGWVAINLARDADRELLPALFEARMFDTADLGEIAELMFDRAAGQLVSRGRLMGLAIARADEQPLASPIVRLADARPATTSDAPPLVIDLSALWAGPLCSHLLQMAGANVIKVESPARPDAMRQGDPAFFTLLNQGKDNVAIDLTLPEGRDTLAQLLDKADIVIEAARPRALEQLGIDAASFVSRRPGMTWITITGHGAEGEAADWVGFGDDCGVAGGLTAALQAVTGAAGFVGDAIADPLTGIAAASSAWTAWSSGQGGRIGLAMSSIVARAVAEEQNSDRSRLDEELRRWGASAGRAFPPVDRREVDLPVRSLGADNFRWLSC